MSEEIVVKSRTFVTGRRKVVDAPKKFTDREQELISAAIAAGRISVITRDASPENSRFTFPIIVPTRVIAL